MTAIRPPEYFPRQRLAALFLAADRVVLADTLPFSRQATHNRARIRTASGAGWLSVPRRHGLGPTPLAEMPVHEDGWRRKHLHALQAAYGMAPYGDHVIAEIGDLLVEPSTSLGNLAVATCRWVHRWIGATSELIVASELEGSPDSLSSIWRASGEVALLALPESADRDRQRLGVETHVLTYSDPEYRQAFDGWEAQCSVLDLIAMQGPRAAGTLRSGTTIRPLAPEA